MVEDLLFQFSIELDFIVKVCLSFLAGLAIGYERESRGKDAGISTHSLVILGAMIFTFLSVQMESENTHRIASAVVSGIGFLGAGVILKNHSAVHNLTTAASLWFSAAIGMAFGFGFYIIGIMSALIAIPILRIPYLGDANTRDLHNEEQQQDA